MSAQALLDRLSGVRQTGPGKWQALCPAHDDRSPSLSIRLTDDGKILVHCWTGCDPEAVITAIGLTWRDLYPDRWQEAEARTLAHGHRRRQKSLADITLKDYARNVLDIAATDLEVGRTHDVWDRATIALAVEIARGGRHE